MRRLALILAFALSSSFAHAQAGSDPTGLIAAIYATYRADNYRPGLPDVYSRRLQALIDTDAKNAPNGEAGKIDWDVFVDGNNWEISKLTIALVSQSGALRQFQATARHGIRSRA